MAPATHVVISLTFHASHTSQPS